MGFFSVCCINNTQIAGIFILLLCIFHCFHFLACPLNKVPLNGECCLEGQVNDGGNCADTCSPARPVLTADNPGVCQCALDMVMYGNLCCMEGQVNNGGVCADTCPVGMCQYCEEEVLV